MEEKSAGKEQSVPTQPPTEQPEAGLPPPVVEQKPRVNKFVILGGILGVLIFIGALFGAYKLGQRQLQPQPSPSPETVVTPTPDPTADWRVYTNTEASFSFKYPQALTPSECKDGLHLFEITNELEASEFCETPPLGKISIEFGTIPLSTGYSQSTDFETTEQQITVDDVEATKQTVKKLKEAPGPNYGVFVTFSKDSHHFLISLREKQYEPTFNLMLSTFKFLEEEGLSPMSPTKVINYKYIENWPLQKSEMGFSFQYPPSYSLPKKNSVDPGVEGEPYCEFLSTRKPAGAQNVESIRVLVVSYEGGSRRQLLMKRLGLFERRVDRTLLS